MEKDHLEVREDEVRTNKMQRCQPEMKRLVLITFLESLDSIQAMALSAPEASTVLCPEFAFVSL